METAQNLRLIYSEPCMSIYAESIFAIRVRRKAATVSATVSELIRRSQIPKEQRGCSQRRNMAVQLANKFLKALWVDRPRPFEARCDSLF